MKFEKMKVRFGNEAGQTFELNYQIRNTKAAQIWANCVRQSSGQKFFEDRRFHNFPNHPDIEIPTLVTRLEKVLGELKSFHPELHFPEFDKSNLQASINNLHFNFAHSHHVEKRIDETNLKAWTDFNVILHSIESALINELSVKRTGLNIAHFIFTWADMKNRVEIPEESYKDFTIQYEFGSVYANYSQVGRHIHEMYRSQDDHLDDTHIQPYRLISSDTNLWFGPTTGHGYAHTQLEAIKAWFEKRKDRFNALGLYWGDPKLAIGRLPVARLEQQLCTQGEIHDFVNYLSRFDRVQNVTVEGSIETIKT